MPIQPKNVCDPVYLMHRHVPRVLSIFVFASLLFAASIGAQSSTWPAARSRHHLLADSAAREVILLGGVRDSTVWTWNGTSWMSRKSVLPERANEAAAFDASRQRLVVYGGDNRGELDDTWEWNRQTWQRAGNASGPGARAHHTMVYDPVRKQVVLFGNSDDATSNDTWGWDGHSWKLLAASGPPRRGVTTLAFDSNRGVVVMFGGYGRDSGTQNTFLNDTWEWNGQRWTRIATPTAPSPRYDAHIAYDVKRNRMVLFGGQTASGSLGDTWEYDGQTWTKLEIAGPSARSAAAIVYDPVTQRVLLFGGRSGRTELNDFWAFDGTWTQISQ